MPGTVLPGRRRQTGIEVAEGDVLLVLESMKMELAIAGSARRASSSGLAWGQVTAAGDGKVEHWARALVGRCRKGRTSSTASRATSR